MDYILHIHKLNIITGRCLIQISPTMTTYSNNFYQREFSFSTRFPNFYIPEWVHWSLKGKKYFRKKINAGTQKIIVNRLIKHKNKARIYVK